MLHNATFSIAFVVGGFVAFELILLFYRHARRKREGDILRGAKQELQDMAKLSLKNPYPMIQVSTQGQVSFINPAALKEFPDIQKQGANHSVIKSVMDGQSRDISYEGKVFRQSVYESITNNQTTYIAYYYDITQRKQYEEELHAARKRAEDMRVEAEDAKEARGNFLANMSHELRTPMNGIIGLSDMLVEMRLDGEKQELIEAVNSSACNLLILLNDILDFSKMEAEELIIENISFDIYQMVKQLSALQKSVGSQKGILVESDIDCDVPHHLIGDPSRLQQILNNLMSNAIKFTQEGRVTLSVLGEKIDSDNFLLKLCVQDSGIGISKEQQSKIFEKFQQADSTTARKFGGTGLGLAITKDLVRLMGGNIGIESEISVGSTFSVTIPMTIGAEAVDDKKASVFDGESGFEAGKRLMIVDDHPVNLLFLRRTLNKFGFDEIDEAKSGKEAIYLFEKNTYDLIFMDCQMPEMDGFEAAHYIRESEGRENKIIIIAATADAMKGAEEKCKQSGMNDYISKPIDKHRLLSLLEKWIPGDPNSVQTPEQLQDHHDVETGADDKVIMDWAHLQDFTDGDKDVEAQIISMFIDSLKGDIAQLKKSLEQKNYTAWDTWVHKMYGACSNVGARSLADLCDQGQTLSEQDTDKIHEIHAAILSEYKHVEKYLNAS